jgi:LasA protease
MMGSWIEMGKRLRHGKVTSLKIQLEGKRRSPIRGLAGGRFTSASWSMISVVLVLALTSLACSVGAMSASDPLFMAPSGSSPAEPTAELVFPIAETPAAPEESNPVVVVDPAEAPSPTPEQELIPADSPPILYNTQAGDTLPVVAIRFGVDPSEITSPEELPSSGLLTPGQLLFIPHRLVNTTSSQKLIPDSEVVYSPSAMDFDVSAFVDQASGYMSTFHEWLGTTGDTSGAAVVRRVALENSIDPRLLLALLEYQSGLVYGNSATPLQERYPMGIIDGRREGLYLQLAWVVNQLNKGYYGWREGHITEITFSNGATARLAPELNAGTVALQFYLAQIYDVQGWLQALDQANGLPALYERMFGNPWIRALDVEPLYPPDLRQPDLILPFMKNQVWSYTGGPHGAWEHDGARAALDFAPGSTESGCVKSDRWVLASAAGLVVRSGNGVVVIDLDGDGYEQTGWALLYLHLEDLGRIPLGVWVERGDLIGHPSCEGGVATGTHVHFARKYNGEWISAGGPLPFVLDGWTAHAGTDPYLGTLTRGAEVVTSSVVGSFESRIIRRSEDP